MLGQLDLLGPESEQLRKIMQMLKLPSDWIPIKTLDTRAQVSFPGWQYLALIVTHHLWED